MSVKNPCVPILISQHFNLSELLSRSAIICKLTELESYRFVAYVQKLSWHKHLVLLVVNDFCQLGCYSVDKPIYFEVTEHKGYLSAVSVCGSVHIEKLY